MTPFQFVMLCAATWYLSHALVNTHGAFGMFDKLREFKGGRWHGRYPTVVQDRNGERTTDLVGLLDCIICTSVWVALALCLLFGFTWYYCFAVAGGAMLAHSYSGWRVNM